MNLIGLGLAVGVLSSFFGVGGGVLIVPILYWLFPNIPPETVIGCSLGIIMINSCLNLYNFRKIGRIPQLRLGMTLSLGMICGITAGRQIISLLDPRSIKLVFATLLVVVIAKTLRNKDKGENHDQWQPSYSPKDSMIYVLISILGGLAAGLTGLGGGAVLVPLLLSVVRVPPNQVSLYSNFGMAFGTFAGFIGYALSTPKIAVFKGTSLEPLQLGYTNIGIIFLVFAGSIFTSKLGASLSQKVSPQLSKNLFALILAFFSARIFITELNLLD